ncbi:MAG TPA: endonuclease/exonuclease/phosphatase family protein [Caulobacteraceae bacterium]|jgi:endonuclease/exonuclease/phosphatase family metal-dependent hydrolase|nr:endonuclease/exonuclease/phosphatase family protein [Caulobacteraceae bacterium]
MTRILTYNVHGCIGTDRRLEVGRIVDVIAAIEPDIVALQELDVGRARSGGVDQAHEIARGLDMACHFNAALQVEEERYGDAILTSLPERLVKAGPLPGLNGRVQVEPRGALWVAVEIEGIEVQIVTSHLGLVPREQRRQAATLAGPDWLDCPDCTAPAILLGDFNATAASIVYRTLAARMRDARRLAPRGAPTSTFPSVFPVLRIDHVFVTPGIRVISIDAPFNALTRATSDHLPLVMEFALAR